MQKQPDPYYDMKGSDPHQIRQHLVKHSILDYQIIFGKKIVKILDTHILLILQVLKG